MSRFFFFPRQTCSCVGPCFRRKQFALQTSVSHSNFRRFNPVYPRQARGRCIFLFSCCSVSCRLLRLLLSCPISAPSFSSASPSFLRPTRPQLLQLPLQGFVAVIHLQVTGLQLLLVADDLVFLPLPRVPLLLEGRGLGLALTPLQQQLRSQTLFCGTRRAACERKSSSGFSWSPKKTHEWKITKDTSFW